MVVCLTDCREQGNDEGGAGDAPKEYEQQGQGRSVSSAYVLRSSLFS